jgi:multidrug efflux system membrane fusion protein
VTEGPEVEVQGINSGDVLATSSFDKLQDKTPITIVTRPAQAGTRGSDAP